MNRNGTILIIVSGIAALLAAIAVAFLTRVRLDAEEGAEYARAIQARLMLAAGLQYVGEGARIGWDVESFGWRDVRDGRPGPRDLLGQPLFVGDPATGVGGAYPAVGGIARCPMQRLRRPPFALALDLVPNPIALRADLGWAQLVDHRVAAPIPAASTYVDFASGDRRPVGAGGPPPWFRVRREDVDTFLITCGAGGTFGFRDHDEAVALGQDAYFASRAVFDDLRAHEPLLFFRARWSPAVAGNVHMHYQQEGVFILNALGSPVLNSSQWADDQPNSRQQTGGFAFIMRVLDEPAAW